MCSLEINTEWIHCKCYNKIIPSQQHQKSGYSQNEVGTQDVLNDKVALPAEKRFHEMLEVLMELHIGTEHSSLEHECPLAGIVPIILFILLMWCKTQAASSAQQCLVKAASSQWFREGKNSWSCGVWCWGAGRDGNMDGTLLDPTQPQPQGASKPQEHPAGKGLQILDHEQLGIFNLGKRNES